MEGDQVVIKKILDKHFDWLTKKSVSFGTTIFFAECYLLAFGAYEFCKFVWNLLFYYVFILLTTQ